MTSLYSSHKKIDTSLISDICTLKSFGQSARYIIDHCTNFASFSGGGLSSSSPSSLDVTSVSFWSPESFLLDDSLSGIEGVVASEDFFTVSNLLFRAEKSVPTSLGEPLTRNTF